MMKEYHRLVHETKAIEPVDLSILDQENVEFVPGKLVAVRKADPIMGERRNVGPSFAATCLAVTWIRHLAASTLLVLMASSS